MRKIQSYHQFTRNQRVNEELNLKDIKNGLMNLGRKMKSGLSKKAAMASLAILLTSAAATGQQTATIKNTVDSAGVKSPCGYTFMDVLQKNCSDWNIIDDLGGKTDAAGNVWYPAMGYYIIKKGDTIFSLSKLFNIDQDLLMSENGITDPSQLKIGQRIKIPLLVYGEQDDVNDGGKDPATQSDEARQRNWDQIEMDDESDGFDDDERVMFEKDPYTASEVVYRVKKGENLYSIAKKLGMTVDELMDYMNPNIEDPAQVKELEEIYLPGYLAHKLMDDEKVTKTTNYKVKQGDTFRKIADEQGTSVETLLKLNNRFGAQGPNIKLNMGDVIKVPAK